MNSRICFLCLLFVGIASSQDEPPAIAKAKAVTADLIPEWQFKATRFRVVFEDESTHTVNLYGVKCIDILTKDDEAKAVELWRNKMEYGFATIADTWLAGFETRNFVFKKLEEGFKVIKPLPKTNPKRSAVLIGDDEVDLAELLVSLGRARVCKEAVDHPDGRKRDEVYQELLALEEQAKKNGSGIWAATKQGAVQQRSIPYDKILRSFNYDIKFAKKKPSTVLDPNEASVLELQLLKYVGRDRAAEIKEYRESMKKEGDEPVFHIADDLLNIDGIGESNLKEIRKNLIFPNSKFTILFEVSSSEISEDSITTLKRVKEIVTHKLGGSCKLRIIGYASVDGSEEMNQKLSEERANGVREYLYDKLSIPKSIVNETQGRGESDPVLSPDKSRRVEITIE